MKKLILALAFIFPSLAFAAAKVEKEQQALCAKKKALPPNSRKHPGSLAFKEQVLCTFAPRATLWDNNHFWNSSKNIASNMVSYKADLDEYIEHINDVSAMGAEPVSAFTIEAPAKFYGRSIKEFGQWVRAVLHAINPKAIDGLQSLEPNEDGVYMDNGWQFTYKGVRLFVVTTAPIYPESNSRYSGGSKQKWVVIHLQPEYVFKWKFANLPKGVTKQFRKEGIRKAFASHGRDYYGDFAAIMGKGLEAKTHEAPRYVKPLHPKDGILKWWIEDKNVMLDQHLISYRDQIRSLAIKSACTIL